MKYLIIVIAIAAYSTLAKAQDTLKSAGSTPDTYSYKLKSTDETGYPGKKFIWSIGVSLPFLLAIFMIIQALVLVVPCREKLNLAIKWGSP